MRASSFDHWAAHTIEHTSSAIPSIHPFASCARARPTKQLDSRLYIVQCGSATDNDDDHDDGDGDELGGPIVFASQPATPRWLAIECSRRCSHKLAARLKSRKGPQMEPRH